MVFIVFISKSANTFSQCSFNNVYDLNICYNSIYIINNLYSVIIFRSNFPLKLPPTYEMVLYIISKALESPSECKFLWIQSDNLRTSNFTMTLLFLPTYYSFHDTKNYYFSSICFYTVLHSIKGLDLFED